MFKTLKYISATVLALAVVLLILPYFIKLNSYKAEISQKAYDAIGRKVTIDGDIHFAILPRPYVTISDLKVASLPGTKEAAVVSVGELDVIVSILPLLKGKVEIAEVHLDEPKIHLEKLSSGKGNWEIDFKAQADQTSQAQSSDLQDSGSSPVLLKHLEVSGGAVSYREGADLTEVNDIDMAIDLESLKGPIEFEVTLKLMGEEARFAGSLKEIGPQIPMDAYLKIMGKKIKFAGLIDQNAKKFKGSLDLKGSLKDLKAYLPLNELPSFMLEPYTFKAQLDASAQAITLHDIDFSLSPLVAEGSVVYDLDRKVGTLKLDLNPGNVHLEVQPTASSKKTLFAGNLCVAAVDIYQFLSVLKVKTQGMPDFLKGPFRFQTHLVYGNQVLDLTGMSFAMGNAQIAGDVLLKNWGQDAACTVDVQTKDAAALGALVNVTVPQTLGPLKVVGQASGLPMGDQKNPLLLDLKVFTANAETKVKGSLGTGSVMKPALDIQAQGNSLRNTLMAVGQKNPSTALGAFALKAHVTGDMPSHVGIALNPSFVTLGKERLDLKGKIDLALGGTKPKVTANMHISSLNLDRLMASNDPLFQDTSLWRVHYVGSKGGAQPPVMPQNHWSHEAIDLGFLRDFDGTISLTIPKIQKGSLVFDSLSTSAQIANGVLDLTSFKANLYGGVLSLKTRISSQKNQSITLSAQLKNAQLRDIQSDQSSIKIIKGLFGCEVDLATQGRSEYQYISNLSGSISFRGQNGVISGFNLQKIVADLENSKDLGSALRLLNTAFSGGQTSFESVECLATINKGDAHISRFLLTADGAKATADGSVNLLKYWMDISSVVTLGSGKIPSFTARLYGPLDKPSNQLKTGKLEQYLLQNVVSGVVDSISKSNGRPEDIIKGVLGLGKKNAPPSTQQGGENSQQQAPQQQQGDPIGKAVGGLLNGILK